MAFRAFFHDSCQIYGLAISLRPGGCYSGIPGTRSYGGFYTRNECVIAYGGNADAKRNHAYGDLRAHCNGDRRLQYSAVNAGRRGRRRCQGGAGWPSCRACPHGPNGCGQQGWGRRCQGRPFRRVRHRHSGGLAGLPAGPRSFHMCAVRPARRLPWPAGSRTTMPSSPGRAGRNHQPATVQPGRAAAIRKLAASGPALGATVRPVQHFRGPTPGGRDDMGGARERPGDGRVPARAERDDPHCHLR